MKIPRNFVIACWCFGAIMSIYLRHFEISKRSVCWFFLEEITQTLFHNFCSQNAVKTSQSSWHRNLQRKNKNFVTQVIMNHSLLSSSHFTQIQGLWHLSKDVFLIPCAENFVASQEEFCSLYGVSLSLGAYNSLRIPIVGSFALSPTRTS